MCTGHMPGRKLFELDIVKGGSNRTKCHHTVLAVLRGTQRLSKYLTLRRKSSWFKFLKLLKIQIFHPMASDVAVRCSTCFVKCSKVFQPTCRTN